MAEWWQWMRLTRFVALAKSPALLHTMPSPVQYMKDSIEAQSFTDTILSTVRLKRHLGAGIVISTQEPTISSDLLGLCSVAIVHRFSSPAWVRALQGQVAAAALGVQSDGGAMTKDHESTVKKEVPKKLSLFHRVVHLRVGEALLFSTSAIVGTVSRDLNFKLVELGSGYLEIKVRHRLTEDGGNSVISS